MDFNVFDLGCIREGTKILSATEISDLPLNMTAVTRINVETATHSIRDDKVVIFVGKEIATLFKDMAVDYDNQGSFYGYIDPIAKVDSDLVAMILGNPIYFAPELTPYTLNSVLFRRAPDGKYDAVHQVAKDFVPKTVNKE